MPALDLSLRPGSPGPRPAPLRLGSPLPPPVISFLRPRESPSSVPSESLKGQIPPASREFPQKSNGSKGAAPNALWPSPAFSARLSARPGRRGQPRPPGHSKPHWSTRKHLMRSLDEPGGTAREKPIPGHLGRQAHAPNGEWRLSGCAKEVGGDAGGVNGVRSSRHAAQGVVVCLGGHG